MFWVAAYGWSAYVQLGSLPAKAQEAAREYTFVHGDPPVGAVVAGLGVLCAATWWRRRGRQRAA